MNLLLYFFDLATRVLKNGRRSFPVEYSSMRQFHWCRKIGSLCNSLDRAKVCQVGDPAASSMALCSRIRRVTPTGRHYTYSLRAWEVLWNILWLSWITTGNVENGFKVYVLTDMNANVWNWIVLYCTEMIVRLTPSEQLQRLSQLNPRSVPVILGSLRLCGWLPTVSGMHPLQSVCEYHENLFKYVQARPCYGDHVNRLVSFHCHANVFSTSWK